MAELMVASPSSSPSRGNEGIEKAAAQAAAGEIFEGLTKEAKADLIGTMGWAGRVFGENCAQALEPFVEKIAQCIAEIKIASGTIQKNMEMPEHYHGGKPAGKNPGDLPANLKNVHTEGNDANVAATATTTNNKKAPGSTGWSETEPSRAALAKAKTIHEQKTAGARASSILSAARGAPEAPSEKTAALENMGRHFKDLLVADTQSNQ